MYGFIEKWLADIIELDCEPFELNSGEMASMVDQTTFSVIRSALLRLYQEDGDAGELQPYIINSDVAGMKIMIHKYWANENVLAGLTGAEAKQLPQYLAFLALGSNRFSADNFITRFKEAYQAHAARVGTVNINTNEAIAAPTVNTEVEEENLGPLLNEAVTPTTLEQARPIIPVNLDEDLDYEDGVDFGEEPEDDAEPEDEDELVDAALENLVDAALENVAQEAMEENHREQDDLRTLNPPAEPETLVVTAANVEAIESETRKRNGLDAILDEMGTVLENESETVPAEEIKPEKSPEEIFLEFMNDRIEKQGYRRNREYGEKEKIAITIGSEKVRISVFTKLSDNIDRNVIVFNSALEYRNTLTRIRSNFNLAEIAKHSVLLVLDPNASGNFKMSAINDQSELSCFGEKLRYLYVVRGDAEKEKQLILNDTQLTSADRKAKLEAIELRPQMSTYARYDAIYKDSATNVVWALGDRCIISFLFKADGSSNGKAFEICIEELGRRFGGKLTIPELAEIDREYHEKVSKANQKDYITFAISNAKSVIDKLQKLHDDAEEKYKEAFDNAMEYGKLSTKFQDQIDAFDHEGFNKKEEEKAVSAYKETIDIEEVLSINITEQTINVYTRNLYAQDERSKKWHDIGTFHITIGMLSNKYSQENTVRIMNTKHQIDAYERGMQAPHVFSSGKICHGTLATGMIEAYKRRNLFELVYQIVLFLQTANTDDSAGKRIDCWPEVPEEVAVGGLDYEYREEEKTAAEEKFDNMLADVLPVQVVAKQEEEELQPTT